MLLQNPQLLEEWFRSVPTCRRKDMLPCLLLAKLWAEVVIQKCSIKILKTCAKLIGKIWHYSPFFKKVTQCSHWLIIYWYCKLQNFVLIGLVRPPLQLTLKKVMRQRFPGGLWLFWIFREIYKKSPAMYSLKMQAAGYINV